MMFNVTFNNISVILKLMGQQFHQCQHMHIYVWPQIIEHDKTSTYVDENPSSGFGQALKCGGVDLVNGITTRSVVAAYWLLFGFLLVILEFALDV